MNNNIIHFFFDELTSGTTSSMETPVSPVLHSGPNRFLGPSAATEWLPYNSLLYSIIFLSTSCPTNYVYTIQFFMGSIAFAFNN